MKKISYKIDKKGFFKVKIKYEKTSFTYIINTITELNDLLDSLDYSKIDKKDQPGITRAIKEMKRMFQVQCLSTYGGPGLGKSTTALNVTAVLKKFGVNADYTSEVAKDKVYGKNLNELKDQSSIIGEQIKRLNTLVKSRDVTIAVQDSPFILGIAYQNKEDPHVDEEDFKEFYVKQYLNYINLNILLKRRDNVAYQKEGRQQSLEQSMNLDNVIKKEVLEDNGLPYIELPAYEASKYMVELGRVMDKITMRERYDVYNSSKDKKTRSLYYHILILKKTISSLKSMDTDVRHIANQLGMSEKLVLSALKEYKNLHGSEYITNQEMIDTLSKSLSKLKKELNGL